MHKMESYGRVKVDSVRVCTLHLGFNGSVLGRQGSCRGKIGLTRFGDKQHLHSRFDTFQSRLTSHDHDLSHSPPQQGRLSAERGSKTMHVAFIVVSQPLAFVVYPSVDEKWLQIGKGNEQARVFHASCLTKPKFR